MKRTTLISLILLFTLSAGGCKKKPGPVKENFRPLLEAARAGNVQELQRLVAAGADINELDRPAGGAPLHAVAGSGDPNAARALIAAGADIEARNGEGDTPLIKAARRNDEEVAKVLIDAGADVDAQGLFLNRPLHWAAQNGCRPLVELLIDRGAHVDSRNRKNETPTALARNSGQKGIVQFLISKGAYVSLHTASYLGDREKIESLIAEGADVNEEDVEGRSPLHFATMEGHKDTVETLLANRANPNLRKRADGATPLTMAVRRGQTDVAELLLKHGADVDARSGQTNVTPLQIASSQGHRDMAALLIAHGADVNAKYESIWQGSDWTPLRHAVQNGHSGVVQLLIENGARADETDRSGRSLVSIAMSRDDRETVQLLLAVGAEMNIRLAAYLGDVDQIRRFVAAGVDVDLKDRSERTPLYVAVQSGHREAAEVLLAAGADVNTRNWNSHTPLWEAAGNGYHDIVELLLAKGAFVDGWRFGGGTPLYSAAAEGHLDIVELLLAHGANVNGRGTGETPLKGAAQFAHREVVELLLAKGADVKAGVMGRELPLSQVARLGIKELVEYLVNNYSPYSIIVSDPKNMREFLRFHGIYYNDLWTPRREDLDGIDAVLKDHLRTGTLIGTKPSFDRRYILSNLDRYCREYCGITRDGTKCIVCQMIFHGSVRTQPPDNTFTGIHGFGNGVVRFIFDVERKEILHIDCEYDM